jgi:hypothetical protein
MGKRRGGGNLMLGRIRWMSNASGIGEESLGEGELLWWER